MLSLQFVERYNQKNENLLPVVTHVRKVAASPPKIGRWIVDDTESSSDDDDSPQVANMADTYLEEWNAYINTNEVVPDGMGTVQWWGVRVISLFTESDLTSIFYSCMEAATQHGSLSRAITLLSWPPQFQVRECSHQLASRSPSDTTASTLILLRRYSASRPSSSRTSWSGRL